MMAGTSETNRVRDAVDIARAIDGLAWCSQGMLLIGHSFQTWNAHCILKISESADGGSFVSGLFRENICSPELNNAGS